MTHFAAQAVIAIENTRLLNELRESLEQQTATSEVLQVISSSPGELEPVFKAVLENAARICQAQFGALNTYDGTAFRNAALYNPPPQFALRLGEVIHPHSESGLGYVARTQQIAHIEDIRTRQPYLEGDKAVVGLADLAGARTLLIVPMLNEDGLIGAIAIYRQEVRPFTDKQIELVKNFAAQAVIAIENTRLLNELRQSLEQQTATADVLSVISSSPGDLEPVFQAMLENAVRICDAKFGSLYRYDGKTFDPVALFGAPPTLAEFVRERGAFEPPAGSNLDRLLRTKDVVRIADESAGPAPGASARFAGARSLLAVPMLKDDVLIGAISIYRREVQPFTDKQVELVQNFAAQAVIAIENTRLLNELRQSLEQQTATADVLRIISSSPGELEPVFQTMLENAIRVCDAKFGTLFRFDGELADRVASVGTPAALVEFQLQRGPFKPRVHANFDRCLKTKLVVHIADELVEPKPGAAAVYGGARTTIFVPMLKENEAVGEIVIYRQEVRPFTDKQIELVSELRRPGRHRHREHAAAQRIAPAH